MQRTTLNHWFQRNASRPVALAALFIALAWVMLLWAFNGEISSRNREGARQLANLLNLSLNQKNRTLTESLLFSSHVNFNAEAAAICQGDRVVISSNGDNSYCREPGSWIYPKDTYQIPGNSDFRLMVTFSRFSDPGNNWRFLLFGMIFTGACYFLLYRIKDRFWKDVFLPLQAGIFNDTPMAIEEFENVRQKRKMIEEAKEREAVLIAVLENKSKVAHNIKSPLRTLQLIEQSIRQAIPERQAKLLEGAVDSINHILGEQQAAFVVGSEKTASRESTKTQKPERVLVSEFLDETLAQKSAEYVTQKNLTFTVDHSGIPFGTFCEVVKHEFRAILSNLVNNSADAIGKNAGSIKLLAAVQDGTLFITVSDNGSGVPQDRRDSIFDKGVTFKEGGTGFGLYHARQYLEQWNGTIKCLSPSDGASFEITMPVVGAPAWFADHVDAVSKKNVVVLDDNRLIHRLWKDRFHSIAGMSETKFYFLSSEEEFETCLGQIGSEISQTIILCDYDLNLPNKTGLDILRAYGVSSMALMVTNNFQSDELIQECEKEQIQILPKPCIYSVPINS